MPPQSPNTRGSARPINEPHTAIGYGCVHPVHLPTCTEIATKRLMGTRTYTNDQFRNNRPTVTITTTRFSWCSWIKLSYLNRWTRDVQGHVRWWTNAQATDCRLSRTRRFSSRRQQQRQQQPQPRTKSTYKHRYQQELIRTSRDFKHDLFILPNNYGSKWHNVIVDADLVSVS